MSDAIRLRPATRDDLPFLFELYEAALGPYVAQTYGAVDRDGERARFLAATKLETHQVVERGGRAIGCLAARRASDEVRLSRVFLLPAFQRGGIGTRLVQDIVRDADRAGLPVRLRVLRVNPARRLYERLGFAVSGETDTHFLMEHPATLAVGVVGDLERARETHVATEAALAHAGAALGVRVDARWLGTRALESTADRDLAEHDAFVVAPGSPYESLDGALRAIRFARETGAPLLGTCGGFQHVVVEFARSVLGRADAGHAEYDPGGAALVITPLACSLAGQRAKVAFDPTSRAAARHGTTLVEEAYRCSYGLDPRAEPALERAGLRVVGRDPEGAARVLELDRHDFFVATLYVPQLSSGASTPHPLFVGLLEAALARKRRTSAC